MEYAMHPMKTAMQAATGLIVFLALSARAQQSPTKSETPRQTEIRTYDLTEFVQTIPDYPLPPEPANENAGELGLGQPNSHPNNPVPPVQEKLDGLMRLILDTVNPKSWTDNGGDVGSLRMLGRQLVVSQTEENQRLVQQLLDGLLSSSVTIEIDAQWAMLTPEQLSEWQNASSEKAQGLLHDQATDRDSFYCQGRLTGFNGQTVSLTSGQTTSVVTGATPVIGTGVAVYDVVSARERSGVSLQVTPRIAAHQNGIVVDVHSKVTQDLAGTGRPLGLIPISSTTQPSESKLAEAPPSNLQTPGLPISPMGRPDRLETAFNTTVRLIAGTPLVIGGMTREPGKQGSRQLCLILTARTIDAPVVNVSIMGDRSGFAFSPMPEYSYVDHAINAKLEQMKILPSEECTDAEFVRRIYLDLAGITPTATEARAFVEDTTPSREKRQQLVDKLLCRRKNSVPG
jgi:hypothetical protein